MMKDSNWMMDGWAAGSVLSVFISFHRERTRAAVVGVLERWTSLMATWRSRGARVEGSAHEAHDASRFVVGRTQVEVDEGWN